MPTTSNFGWTTPADTDLVKDGAAAIRTLGNGIDTSFLDLKGGTTNQVLAKNSNTDLDFKWVADATGIPATIFDAKGDIIAATAADTADRLAVGTNGHILTADSTTATGLKWAAAPSGNLTLSQIATGSMSGTSVSISSLTSYDQITVFLEQINFLTSNSSMRFRLNGSSSSIYNYFGGGAIGSPSVIQISSLANDAFKPSNNQDRTNSNNNYVIQFTNCKASGFTYIQANYSYVNSSGNAEVDIVQGWFGSSAAVSSIEITNVAGNTFNGGNYYVIAG